MVGNTNNRTKKRYVTAPNMSHWGMGKPWNIKKMLIEGTEITTRSKISRNIYDVVYGNF